MNAKTAIRRLETAGRQLDRARANHDQALLDARRAGLTYRQIAQHAGITHETVRARITELEEGR